ncbi:hypothetical protein V9O75_002835 [Shigella sonnei]
MLIRCSGYNAGVQEYLEEGIKNGRDFTRDELDERVILDGDLDVTRKVYESIPDNGQERYLTFTLSFKEDEVSNETLHDITQDFKNYLMTAYRDDEFNFYAEAHLPKIKATEDKRTGEFIDRKPHIHIVVPRKNMLSGNEMNPVGKFESNERFFEAFQEQVNQKYNLQSPRDNVRVNPLSAADILSRYKGDDFLPKNRAFKEDLVRSVIDKDVRTTEGFYNLVASYGETKVRNKGKPNEYIAVKLDGDAKFTNLKETIFGKNFIEHRALSKPPLDKHIIETRLDEWQTRARELKYVSKAGEKLRQKYKHAEPGERVTLLKSCETAFYLKYGGHNEQSLRRSGRTRNHGSGVTETRPGRTTAAAYSLQNVSGGIVGAGAKQERKINQREMLLSSEASLHMGTGRRFGNSGLLGAVHGRGRGRSGSQSSSFTGQFTHIPALTRAAEYPTGIQHRRRGRDSQLNPQQAGQNVTKKATLKLRIPSVDTLANRRGFKVSEGFSRHPYYRPNQILSLNDVQKRTASVMGKFDASAVDTSGKRRSLKVELPSAAQLAKQESFKIRRAFNRNTPFHVYAVRNVEQRTTLLMGKFVPLPMVQQSGRNRPARPAKKSASTVPAWLLRRLEQNAITPAFEKTSFRQIERDFRERRSDLLRDTRLTREDKTQLLSILEFERLRTREKYANGFITNEDREMAAKDIRSLIDEEKNKPDFSISTGAKRDPDVSATSRFKNAFDKMRDSLAESRRNADQPGVQLNDLYTKRGRNGAVHYLDKKTDKSLFVDTGEVIKMRRNGISKEAVGVALELAQGRFGSTLNITGNRKFKDLVIEAAIEKNLDIHFTDKSMNARMAERKLELQEETGAAIGGAEQERDKDQSQQTAKDAAAPAQPEAAEESQPIILMDRDGYAWTGADFKWPSSENPPQVFQPEDALKTAFALASQYKDQLSGESIEIHKYDQATGDSQRFLNTNAASSWQQAADAFKQHTGVDLDKEQYFQWRDSPEAVTPATATETATTTTKQDDSINYGVEFDRVEQAAKEVMREFEQNGPNEALQERAEGVMERFEYLRTHFQHHTGRHFPRSLDHRTNEHVSELKGVVSAGRGEPGQEHVQHRDYSRAEQVIIGRLIEHGPAPYKHDKDNQDSYFVRVETGRGIKELWGQGLEHAIHSSGAEPGRHVKLYDLGQEETKVPVLDKNGDIAKDSTGAEMWKPAIRRAWGAEAAEPGQSFAQPQQQQVVKQKVQQ